MIAGYPSGGGSVRFADVTGINAPVMKRPIHILPDGSAVAVIPQQNAPASRYGSKDGVCRIQVWYTPADRSSWTLKTSYSLPFGMTPVAADEEIIHCGSVTFNDGSIYFAWRSTVGGISIKGIVFPKGAGATWTNPTAVESIFTPAERFPFRFDLDINKVSNRVYIGWMYRRPESTVDTMGVDLMVRMSSSSFLFLAGDLDMGGNSQGKNLCEDFSLAVDTLSDAIYTRLAYCVSIVSTTKDYGDTMGFRTVRVSDNVEVAAGRIRSGMNAGRAASRRNNWLFANADGEFTMIGVGGAGKGEAWVYRAVTTAEISATTVPWSAKVSPTYSSAGMTVDRNLSLHTDVAVSYANDTFNVLFHNDTYVNNIPGRIEGSKAIFDPGVYVWDNHATYDNPATSPSVGAPAPSSTIYGGVRGADAINTFDTLIGYYKRGETLVGKYDTAWSHQYNRASRAPANVLPRVNSIQTSGIPVLGVYADLDQQYARSRIYPVWQIAKDAGFTTSLIEHVGPRSVTVANTHVPNSYVLITDRLGLDKALASGTWYIRGAHQDAWGTRGAWTAAQQFSVSHQPSASPISPSGGAVFRYNVGGEVTFVWTFSDSYEYDGQTAYRILIETNDEVPSPVVDTDKVASSTSIATISIADTAKNMQLRWSVQLWDVDDTAGEMSEYALFMVAEAPTIEFISPVNGSVVDNARPSFDWSYLDVNDSFQVSYRVVLLREGAAIFDSAWKSGAVTSFQATTLLLTNESSYTAILYVRNSIGLESSVATSFTTEWIAPADPLLANLFIDGNLYDTYGHGYVLVTWGNQNPDPEFLSWRLYRRFELPESASIEDPGLDWELVREEFSVSPPLDAPAYRYLDYTVPSNHDVHYLLTQTVMRFGTVVESRKVSPIDTGKVIRAYSGAYWLIDPEADGVPEDVIKLPGASADSYTDEYETEEMNIVGRGRHVDIGDRFGYRGTLNLPLRFLPGSGASDGARRQKLDLERFKEKRKAVYLRSPFGDVFMVNTGDIQFQRVAGVGSSEFIDVSLPYVEVFK